MTGENNLQILLRNMQPVLQPNVYVFATGDLDFGKLNPICMFQESEGTTYIVPKDTADEVGIDYIYPCRMITLNIHSDLNAVGFLAAITTEFSKHKISVNAISAYYHDHLFVPADRADDVMKILASFAT